MCSTLILDDLFLSYIYASSESAIVSFHARASSLGTSLNVNASRGELQTQVLGSSGKLQVLRPNGTMEQVDIPPELVWGTNTGYMWLVPELSYNIGFQVISAVRSSFLDCGKILNRVYPLLDRATIRPIYYNLPTIPSSSCVKT